MMRSRGEKYFSIGNYIFFTLFSLVVIYPFWEVIRISFSGPADIARMGFRLFPQRPVIDAYVTVTKNNFLWRGYANSIVRVLIGVSLHMVMMVLAGYPLSKKYMPGRKWFTLMAVFTMFFGGGLIPSYLLIAKWLNLYDTIWAMVLPGMISTYSMFILRNYFMSLPESLSESARIDGANEMVVLLRIILPMSVPILMTVMMWSIVGHWNSWFDCLIYIKTPEKYVLQAILRKIIIDATPQFSSFTVMTETNVPAPNVEAVKSATIIVSTLPIMCIYPFIQKHFVKGIMLGSLKG